MVEVAVVGPSDVAAVFDDSTGVVWVKVDESKKTNTMVYVNIKSKVCKEPSEISDVLTESDR